MLLVDDEPAVREAARQGFARLNLTAVVSADGRDALAKASLHRHALRAVITDLHMPNMNGVAFLRALRAVLPEVPVIVSSGRLDEATAIEFQALGVRLVLDKPFTEEKLVAVLQSALRLGE